jgi:hypothetical protein
MHDPVLRKCCCKHDKNHHKVGDWRVRVVKSTHGRCRFPSRTSRALRRSNVPSELRLTFRTNLDSNTLAPLGASTTSHVRASRSDSSSSAIAASHRSQLEELSASLRDGSSESIAFRMWHVFPASATSGSCICLR